MAEKPKDEGIPYETHLDLIERELNAALKNIEEMRSKQSEAKARLNLVAWQLLGGRGLEVINRDETQSGYDTPPSDELWSQLLAEVEANGGAALILLDEFLMWAHGAASPEASDPTRGPVWYERLKNFFQRLSQAVVSSQRSCLVVSLLATEPTKVDEIGREILAQCNNGLGRVAQDRSPVEKNDLPELLRRRLAATCDMPAPINLGLNAWAKASWYLEECE